jgi:hypothetical protein
MARPSFEDIEHCQVQEIQSFSQQVKRILKKHLHGLTGTNLIMRIVANSTWEHRRKQFMEAHKVRPWNWATNKEEKCLNVDPSILNPSVWNEETKQERHNPEYRSECLDHIDVWLKGKNPHLMTSQPYYVTKEDLKMLIAYCDKYDIDFQIDAESFYFPGHTIRILFKKGHVSPYDACAHEDTTI